MKKLCNFYNNWKRSVIVKWQKFSNFLSEFSNFKNFKLIIIKLISILEKVSQKLFEMGKKVFSIFQGNLQIERFKKSYIGELFI